MGVANGDGRYNKRLKVGDNRVENRGYSSGRDERSKELYEKCRITNVKRDWRRRDGDRSRKRERDVVDRTDRDMDRDRDNRGYWERDSSGKVVYQVGPWDADHSRDVKKARLENPEDGVKEEKEKSVEEQARKYQLDVLERRRRTL